MPHVTLAGDATGDYVIEEQRADGKLLLAPEPEWRASMRRRGLRPMTGEEFDAWMADNGPHMLPPDDEG